MFFLSVALECACVQHRRLVHLQLHVSCTLEKECVQLYTTDTHTICIDFLASLNENIDKQSRPRIVLSRKPKRHKLYSDFISNKLPSRSKQEETPNLICLLML